MQTWSIISQKGGQGKTTLATSLAVEASRELEPDTVVILDTDDRQGTACYWNDRRPVKDLIVENTGLAVLPRNHGLASTGGAELVIIDTPANSRDIATEAASFADFVIVPVVPRAFDIASVMQTLKQLKMVGRPYAVVLSMVKPTGHEGDETSQLFVEQGHTVLAARLHDRKDFANAGAAGQCVTEYDPKSKAAAECRAVFDEIKRLSGFSAKRLSVKEKVA